MFNNFKLFWAILNFQNSFVSLFGNDIKSYLKNKKVLTKSEIEDKAFYVFVKTGKFHLLNQINPNDFIKYTELLYKESNVNKEKLDIYNRLFNNMFIWYVKKHFSSVCDYITSRSTISGAPELIIHHIVDLYKKYKNLDANLPVKIYFTKRKDKNIKKADLYLNFKYKHIDVDNNVDVNVDKYLFLSLEADNGEMMYYTEDYNYIFGILLKKNRNKLDYIEAFYLFIDMFNQSRLNYFTIKKLHEEKVDDIIPRNIDFLYEFDRLNKEKLKHFYIYKNDKLERVNISVFNIKHFTEFNIEGKIDTYIHSHLKETQIINDTPIKLAIQFGAFVCGIKYRNNLISRNIIRVCPFVVAETKFLKNRNSESIRVLYGNSDRRRPFIYSYKYTNGELITKLDVEDTHNNKRFNVVGKYLNLVNDLKKKNLEFVNFYERNRNMRSSVIHYVGDGYETMNNEVFKRIYHIQDTKYNTKDFNDAFNLNKTIQSSSKQLQSTIFNNNYYPNGFFKLNIYRTEHLTNVGDYGLYSNLKPGDKIVLPAFYSTSLNYIRLKSYVKPILLDIDIDLSKDNCLLGGLAGITETKELEVILNVGTELEVIYIRDVLLDGKVVTKVKLKCINTPKSDNLSMVIEDAKKRRFAISNNKTYSNKKPIFDYNNILAPLINNYMLISLLLNDTPLNNKDILDKYNNVKFADTPSIYSKQAYIGEKLVNNRELNKFCKDDNFIENKEGFNIMSFNVHNFVKLCNNAMVSNNMRRQIKFLLDFIDKYTNLDILCLQEVVPFSDEINDPAQEKNDFIYLINKMKERGYKYHFISNTNYDINYLDPHGNPLKKNYYILANCIFSKHELFNKIAYGLIGNRVLQTADILVNNLKIKICNTHLEFNDSLEDNFMRGIVQSQITQVIEIFDTIEIPIILTGDFNHDINKSSYLFHEFMVYFKIVSPLNTGKFDITGLNSNNVIDYILTWRDTEITLKFNPKYSKIIKSSVSDHYPVYCSFTLPPKTIEQIKLDVYKDVNIYNEPLYDIIKNKLTNHLRLKSDMYLESMIELMKHYRFDYNYQQFNFQTKTIFKFYDNIEILNETINIVDVRKKNNNTKNASIILTNVRYIDSLTFPFRINIRTLQDKAAFNNLLNRLQNELQYNIKYNNNHHNANTMSIKYSPM